MYLVKKLEILNYSKSKSTFSGKNPYLLYTLLKLPPYTLLGIVKARCI
jgi:hypothetical protein